MDAVLETLRTLSKNQLAQLGDMLSKELRRVRRDCEDGADCETCKNAAYCSWLNQAQLCVYSKINEKISANS